MHANYIIIRQSMYNSSINRRIGIARNAEDS